MPTATNTPHTPIHVLPCPRPSICRGEASLGPINNNTALRSVGPTNTLSLQHPNAAGSTPPYRFCVYNTLLLLSLQHYAAVSTAFYCCVNKIAHCGGAYIVTREAHPWKGKPAERRWGNEGTGRGEGTSDQHRTLISNTRHQSTIEKQFTTLEEKSETDLPLLYRKIGNRSTTAEEQNRPTHLLFNSKIGNCSNTTTVAANNRKPSLLWL